jgi:outer membrane murein-binding lipoprotein Lpp
MTRILRLSYLLPLLFLFGGCASVQYSAMEKVGVYKRDILVDRVEDAREAQQAAKQEVTSAYEQFTALVKVDGGDLEKTYRRLQDAVDDTQGSVEEVDERIEAIEQVAGDLFDEWRDELDEYSSASLRQSSEQKLRDTKIRYQRMLDSMKRARSRIDPVLQVFQDHVLFLKHNLNARALASLKGEVASIEGKVDRLIGEMEAAIAEADRFIQTME